MRALLIVALVGAAVVGAGVLGLLVRDDESAGPVAVRSALVGPEWQLEDFLAGDGSVVTPDDPASYTVRFEDDGTFSAVADCNVAEGTYTDDGGSLKMTITQTTRASCSSGSYSRQFLTRMGDVRTYVLEEGKLYVNLYADAGTTVFRQG